jgi:hypothetical protein
MGITTTEILWILVVLFALSLIGWLVARYWNEITGPFLSLPVDKIPLVDVRGNEVQLPWMDHRAMQQLLHTWIHPNAHVVQLGDETGVLAVVVNDALEGDAKKQHVVVESSVDAVGALLHNKERVGAQYQVVEGAVREAPMARFVKPFPVNEDTLEVQAFTLPQLQTLYHVEFDTWVSMCGHACFEEILGAYEKTTRYVQKMILDLRSETPEAQERIHEKLKALGFGKRMQYHTMSVWTEDEAKKKELYEVKPKPT